MDHAIPLNGDLGLTSEGALPVSPARHKAKDEQTETMPRLPSQKFVDWTYAVHKIGLGGTITLIGLWGCIIAMPWIGTNVVVPIVNSVTKYVETQAEISKSLVVVSQNSVKVSAQVMEQISDTKKGLEHIAARLDASLEVQKETQATLKKLESKL